MKILCISDAIESLVYSSNAKSFYSECDLVLSAGDLSLKYYDYIMTILNKDLYYVFGNHNLEHYDKIMANANDINYIDYIYEDKKIETHAGFLIDGKVKRIKKHDLIIAGLGGSMLYNNGKSQFSEKKMKMRILKMVPRLLYNKIRYGRYLDILVTHAAPLGLGDDEDLCHKGFSCFLKFMEKYEPKYLLHGHIHLYDENTNRVNYYHNTQIINVFRSCILDDDELGEL